MTKDEWLKERTLNIAGEMTQHWMETGERPSIVQLIQLSIYLEQLGVIYPQRLNLCEEELRWDDEPKVIPEIQKLFSEKSVIET